VSGARPKARKEGLLVRDLGDEVVVYEVESHRGHSLNRTATLVWRASDGKKTVAGIAAQLGRELGVPADEPLVRFALQKLREARLLEPGTGEAATLTRRQVARRIGRAALLPVVVSLLAPRPSEAATCTCGVGQYCNCSGAPDYTSCWNGSTCDSSVCCGGACCQICIGGVGSNCV
jgi:hypothetical protein